MASFPFARRYLGNRCFFLFLELLRCFSSPRFLLTGYVFACGYLRIAAGGFPHSDICGSSDICSSPQLFAACHVLLRLPVPRHPPYALSNLTIKCLCVASHRSFDQMLSHPTLSLLLLNVKCWLEALTPNLRFGGRPPATISKIFDFVRLTASRLKSFTLRISA